MKHKLWMVLLAVLLLVVVAGCSEPPVQVAHGDVCSLENDDKVVSVDGYFQLGLTMYCSDVSGNYRCGLDFVSAPGAEDGFSVDVIEGDGNNELSPLPDSYTDADLKLQTDNNETVTQENKVRITGDLSVSQDPVSNDMVCYMYVDKIEVVE